MQLQFCANTLIYVFNFSWTTLFCSFTYSGFCNKILWFLSTIFTAQQVRDLESSNYVASSEIWHGSLWILRLSSLENNESAHVWIYSTRLTQYFIADRWFKSTWNIKKIIKWNNLSFSHNLHKHYKNAVFPLFTG